MKPENIATRDAYGDALAELGSENPNIVVLDADLSKSTRTITFAKKFPERFFNFGVAEQNMMNTAAGLATCGKIPFASTFAVFASGRAFDQVRMSVCYARLNVKIVATHGGVSVGEDGASHQATEDIALMRALPNMTVIVPCDGIETKKAVRAAAAYFGPIYMRLGRMKVPVLYDDDYQFEIGKSAKLREGKDVTLIANGAIVYPCLEAAKILESQGIEAAVLDMHTVKPIDEVAIIRAAYETGAIVTCEEHNIIGGLGSAVAEVLVENLPVPMKRLGLQNQFGESGDAHELLNKYGLAPENIAAVAIEVIQKKGAGVHK